MEPLIADGMRTGTGIPDAPSAVQIDLRLAGMEDARRIWLWRNEPAARRCSFRTDFIPWEWHLAWFGGKVQSCF